MEKIQHFLGKICTILTHPCNRNFDDQQHANVFTGRVKEINSAGIWMELLPIDGRLAFFANPIIGILEEKFVPVKDEELNEVQKVLENKFGQQSNNLIQLQGIKNLAGKAKEIKNETYSS